MKRILHCALCVIIATSAHAQRYGVLSDSIGESWTQYVINNHVVLPKKNHYPLACHDTHPPKPQEWECDSSLFPVENREDISVVSYHFINSQLNHIDAVFDRIKYPTIRAAIIVKYGEPTSTETHTYQNGLGATFDGEVLTWRQPDTAITLNEIAGDPINSGFSITDMTSPQPAAKPF